MDNYNILISGEVFLQMDESNQKKFIEITQNYKNINFFMVSFSESKIKQLKKFGFEVLKRGNELLNIIIELEETVLILGYCDKDFQLSKKGKMLLFYLEGVVDNEQKVLTYGKKINIKNFFKILDLIDETKGVYYNYDLDKNFKVISLINARYKVDYLSAEERQIALKFENLLKEGEETNKEIFIYFILIMFLKNIDFSEYYHCFYYPTSRDNGGKNELMERLCEEIRLIISNTKLKQENLFFRYKEVKKSRYLGNRERIPLDRHLNSIDLIGEKRIYNKGIIILDDYSTNGTSYKVVRELLKNKNTKKILFLTIGNFGNVFEGEYNQENSHFNLEKIFEILHNQ